MTEGPGGSDALKIESSRSRWYPRDPLLKAAWCKCLPDAGRRLKQTSREHLDSVTRSPVDRGGSSLWKEEIQLKSTSLSWYPPFCLLRLQNAGLETYTIPACPLCSLRETQTALWGRDLHSWKDPQILVLQLPSAKANSCFRREASEQDPPSHPRHMMHRVSC